MKKQGKTYIVPHRRRREGRTNYRKRLALLKSGRIRFVVRKSGNNMVCQMIEHDSKGDKTLLTVNALHLKKLGWRAGTGNIPSAYLTGLLCGIKAKKMKIKKAVLDTGVVSPTKGSRIYASLKGALDAGIEIPHSEEIFPSEERITGKHIASYLKKYSDLPQHFEEIKRKILELKQ